jgi:ubiquinone/menaquinone biosynthesis C-methylase UbiE
LTSFRSNLDFRFSLRVECFKEIKRVLKPAGKFAIINEVYQSELFRERSEIYTAAGDIQIFTLEELKQWLEELEFKNVTTAVVKADNWLCCIGEK